MATPLCPRRRNTPAEHLVNGGSTRPGSLQRIEI